MIDRLKKMSSTRPLVRKLIISIVLFSSLLTLVIVSTYLFFEYQSSINAIEEEFQQIESSYIEIVSSSLWDFDEKQLENQLVGLLHFPNIEYATINTIKKNNSGHTIWSKGQKLKSNFIEKEFNLTYKEHKLGKLYLQSNLESIYWDLINKAFYITSGK